MKTIHSSLTCLAITAFTLIVGCDKPDATSRQLNNVQVKTAEMAQDMKDYTYAQRAEFTEKMQGQLAEINHDLDQLAAKIEKSSDAVQAEAKPKLQVLRDQTARLSKQLEEVKNATESTWESVKAGSKTAYKDLKDGFNKARQWVSDKIAP